jgi:chorismate mutase
MIVAPGATRTVLVILVGLGSVGTGSPARATAGTGPPLVALVDAATQRLLTADPAAAAKWGTTIPIDDPPREQEVLRNVEMSARQADIDPMYVHRVFRDQIDATEAVEYVRFAQWKLDPATAPATRDDLSASRALIDQLNTVMVAQIAENIGILHSPACPAILLAARFAAAVEYQLSPLYLQAQAHATQSYCTP